MKLASLILLCFVFVTLCFSNVAAEAPAIISMVNGNSVSQFANTIIPSIIASIKGKKFEEISGKKDHIHYTISNMYVSNISVGPLTIDNSKSIAVAIPDIFVELKCDWKYHASTILPRGSGTAVITMKDGTIGGSFMLPSYDTPNGKRPAIQVQNMVVEISKLTVDVHGSIFSWLYDILFKAVSGEIKSAIETGLRVGLQDGIQQAGTYILSTLPYRANVGTTASIDLSVSGDATVGNGVVTLGFDGEVKPGKSFVHDPTIARNNISIAPNGRLFQIGLDVYVFNTALHVIFGTGEYHYSFTDANKPSNWPALNTASFKTALPALYNDFPDMPLRVQVYLGEVPIVTADNKLTGTFPIALKFEALRGDVYEQAFILRMQGTADMAAMLKDITPGQALFAEVKDYSTVTTVASTKIGDFDVNAIKDFLDLTTSSIIVPQINTVLFSGIPLPTTSNMVIVNPEFSFIPHGIMISADLAINV